MRLTKSLGALEGKLRGRSNPSRKLEVQLRELKSELARVNASMEVAKSSEGGDILDAAHVAKAWLTAMELEARIDAQIDKQFGRFATLKEYKKIYAAQHQKLIEHKINEHAPRNVEPRRCSSSSGSIANRSRLAGRGTAAGKNEDDVDEWG